MSEQPEANRRRALGKGLESLLPRAMSLTRTSEPAQSEGPGTPLQIPLEEIERSPFQPRTSFNDQRLIELAASISSSGVVQPIVVRRLPSGAISVDRRRAPLAGVKAGQQINRSSRCAPGLGRAGNGDDHCRESSTC